jgi:hypothetical protein
MSSDGFSQIASRSYTAKGFRFVADAQLRSTGNIGTVTRVRAVWYQAGGREILEDKTVRFAPGQRMRVGFTKLVGGDEIDLIQALDYDQQCNVFARIMDTFGEAR